MFDLQQQQFIGSDSTEAGRRPWLAMDSATSTLSIGLFQEGTLLGSRHCDAERNHSIKLVPSVQELVASSGFRMSELGGVIAGQGPGSYTGVRIAVTVAKTFAWSLGIPLVGVSSLEALAHGEWRLSADVRRAGQALAESAEHYAVGASDASARTWVIPLLDARRGQAFTAIYGDTAGGWASIANDGIRLLDDWLKSVRAAASGDAASGITVDAEYLPARVVFVGETEVFEERLAQAAAGQEGWLIKPSQMDALDVAVLGQQRARQGLLADVHDFAPNYTQLAEAEKKYLAKQQCGQ